MTNLVVPLALATVGCGGKAAHLAALVGAGLPVPDGFALAHAAFAAVVGDPGPVELPEVGHVVGAIGRAIVDAPVPAALAADVQSRAEALGRVAVRSSVSIEDLASGGAPGIFTSCIDLAPSDVWSAIRAVWASALSPLAVGYARARGVSHVEIGVIVQHFVPGTRTTIYTRAPGRATADEVWIEPAGAKVARLSRSSVDPRVGLALAAEAAIGASAGADVELIERSDGLALVQARPIRHPVAPTRTAPPAALFAFSRATPGVTWHWDAAHNPEPLSEAQAGLVELVDDPAGFPLVLPAAAGEPPAPYAMRVVSGYLYTARRGEHIETPPPVSAAELAARWTELATRMIAVLDAAAPTLPGALDAYLAFYRIWAREVAPLLAAARAVLPARLAASREPTAAERLAVILSGPRTTTVAARITAAAAGELDEQALLRAIGDLAPAWDVATPTFAETPALVRAAVARARVRSPPRLTPSADDLATARALGDDLEPLVVLARLAGDLSELDDVYFARAQRLVRSALLAAAPDGLGDDVFWLPLADIASGAPIDVDTARARAAGARAAARRAREWAMPLSVREGQPTASTAGVIIRGVGTGARVVGRVAHVGGPAEIPPGAIAVVRAVTPALALALDQAAAIVAEFGGILDHGAALARELGIPCVTGCAGAWDALADDVLVAVDGDAGTVDRL